MRGHNKAFRQQVQSFPAAISVLGGVDAIVQKALPYKDTFQPQVN